MTSSHALDQLQRTHPLTAAAFAAMPDGSTWLERLLELDGSVVQRDRNTPVIVHRPAVLPPPDLSVDLVYAGGTLGVIHAAVMASVHCHRVVVADRHRAAMTHRDWNISLAEAEELVRIGLLTGEELDSVITARYDHGIVAFHGDGCTVQAKPLRFTGVLDMAVDANALLRLCREKIEQSGTGSLVLDGYALSRVDVRDGMVATFTHAGGTMRIAGTVLLDMMGTSSPIARQFNPGRGITHLCPTVGTVASGFVEGNAPDAVRHDVGEILVTTTHADDLGRQLIWEGFPAGEGRYTSYLFFYDTVDSPVDKSLLSLYETYFRTLDSYKRRGPGFRIHKPVFGYIPSIHHRSIGKSTRVASDRVLCLGDAAGLSSPLTYCGFGSFVRTLDRTTTLLDQAVRDGLMHRSALERISAFEPNVAVSSGFSKFLIARPGCEPRHVNEPLNMITELLGEMDPAIRTELFRDQLRFTSYNTLMSTVPKRYPHALGLLIRTLRVRGMASWMTAFLGFAWFEWRRRRFERRLPSLLGSRRSRAGRRFRMRADGFLYLRRDIYPAPPPPSS